MADESTSKAARPDTLPLCDIVMEGGVTSGIIYPTAVVELSKQFRLKNIGGTSVGALAAALAAAAEVGRARDPEHHCGFERLGQLPDQLQQPGFSGHGKSRLFDLFQPGRSTRPLFNLLAATLNRPTKKHVLAYLVLAGIRNFPWQFWSLFLVLLAAQALAGIGSPFEWAVALLFSAICGVGMVSYAVWKALTGRLVANGYGLCTGHLPDDTGLLPAPGDKREPLTLWLSRLINQYAGKEADEKPLTFGDLWKPCEHDSVKPPPWLQDAGITQWRYIDLQIITTNLAHGRPYCFPYEDDDQRLFFKPRELEKWFPKNVVKHMEDCARQYDRALHQGPPETLPDGLLRLPPSADLPVVFAARLSLSFPFLLSAIPLYALDHESQKESEREFKRCWFSDGGICSDFPIHFFDAPLPLWPTFGIKLEDERLHYPIDVPTKGANRYYLPNHNDGGRRDAMLRFDEADNGGARLRGFAAAMLDSARNWRDRMLVRTPAIRDRVVRLYLKKTEGGLNLNMPKDVQAPLAEAGTQGARMLVARYCPASVDKMNFNNHRWVRLRKLTRVVEKDLASIHHALAARPPGVTPWDKVLTAAIGLSGWDPYTPTLAQQSKMRSLLEHLRDLSIAADHDTDLLKTCAPRRDSVIRIVPDI